MAIQVGRAQLIRLIAEDIGCSQKESGDHLDSLIKHITNTLGTGGEVRLANFATFLTKERSAREGRNPRTGEKIHIAAKRVPSIRAGKALKDAAEGS